MDIEALIKELETKVVQITQQLEQSLANSNFMAGVKTEAERILKILKQPKVDVEPTEGVHSGD